MRLPKLGERLRQIAYLAGPCDLLVDVGCDHAFLPVYMLQHRLAQSALGIEINLGPLVKARAFVKRAQLDAYIQIIQGDGLSGLPRPLTAADTCVIAGLGGYEIARIIAAVPTLDCRLVLQANWYHEQLLICLAQRGYQFSEYLLTERGRLYSIYMARSGGVSRTLSLSAAFIGEARLLGAGKSNELEQQRIKQLLGEARQRSKRQSEYLPVCAELELLSQT